ncbi:MAG: hypothetical protein HQL71_12725 [Magnetococcales bacterium]|nr:hypothetical protein [Magnetococcales bacterium]
MSLHHPLEKMSESRIAWLFLIVVFSGLLIWKADLLFQVQNNRHSPVEPDDIIGYMTQAVTWNCRLGQTCQGLDDLSEVLGKSTDDPWVKYYRYRQFHRLLYDNSPLYSLSLRFIRLASSSWEEASNHIALLGMVLLQFTVTWLLVVLYGPIPASIGLGLSAFFWMNYFIFPFPWLFSLAFGLGSIAAILQNSRGWVVFWSLGIIAMLFHPFGRLAFLAGTFFYLIQFQNYKKQELIRFLLLSMAIFIAVFFIGWFLNGFSDHVGNPHNAQESQSIYAGILQNLSILLSIVKGWANRFGGGVNFVWLFAAGVLLLPASWRMRCVLALVISSLALLASTLLVLPGYAGALTGRVALPVSMILCGVLGVATWYALVYLWSSILYFKGSFPKLYRLNTVAAVIFVVGALQSFTFFLAPIPAAANNLVNHISARHNYLINPDQIKNVAKYIKKGDRILFLSEEAFYYYYIQTNFKKLATIAASLDDNLEDRYRNLEGWPPRFISIWNPLKIGRIDLAPSEEFTIKVEKGSPFNKGLAIKSARVKGLPSILSITTDTGNSCNVELPNIGGWQTIPCVEAATKNVKVKRAAGDKESLISIIGVKFGDSSLNWPWNVGVSITPNSKYPDVNIRFNEADIKNARFKCPVRVIDDQGSFVIAQRQCDFDPLLNK